MGKSWEKCRKSWENVENYGKHVENHGKNVENHGKSKDLSRERAEETGRRKERKINDNQNENKRMHLESGKCLVRGA